MSPAVRIHFWNVQFRYFWRSCARHIPAPVQAGPQLETGVVDNACLCAFCSESLGPGMYVLAITHVRCRACVFLFVCVGLL